MVTTSRGSEVNIHVRFWLFHGLKYINANANSKFINHLFIMTSKENSPPKPRNTEKKNSPSWADIVENKVHNTADDQDNVVISIQDEQAKIPMFALSNNETPFLIGVRGRNISLIRKYTHMLITIENYVVYMSPIRPNHDIQLAWRMVFSASFGGILRWFETPQATKRGYPKERTEEFEKLAQDMNFSLDLLRSRRGHMCLMLIPQIQLESCTDDMSDTQINDWKVKISEARTIMLQALNSNNQSI